MHIHLLWLNCRKNISCWKANELHIHHTAIMLSQLAQNNTTCRLEIRRPRNGEQNWTWNWRVRSRIRHNFTRRIRMSDLSVSLPWSSAVGRMRTSLVLFLFARTTTKVWPAITKSIITHILIIYAYIWLSHWLRPTHRCMIIACKLN